MRLHEAFPTKTTFTQRGTGKITGGTGAFADARGRVKGGGTGAFTDEGLVATLVYVVRVRGNRGEND
jgi:hypothetical protein